MKSIAEPYFIGLDIGTGSTKAVAYNFSLEPLVKTQIHYTLKSPEPGYYEADPEQIWEGVLSCIRDLRKILNHKPEAIGLSAAMHGLMIMSRKGQILSPMLTWADIRSVKIADRIKNSKNAEDLYRKTGTPIHSMSPLCKIIWFKENEPDLFKGPVCMVSIKSFIWFRLFGIFEEDWSMASATGMMDILHRSWYEPAFTLSGLGSGQLPQLINTLYYRSEITSKEALGNGFDPGIPIISGASDGCTASLGSFTLDSGTCAITIGTSGAVRVCSYAPVYDFPSMIFNYILDEEIWVSGGAINNGGIALDWAIQKFFPGMERKDYRECFQKVEAIPAGSDGLLFLPYLTGERAPLWDEKSSAGFIGIKLNHSPAHFLRAVIEGIGFSLLEILKRLERDRGDLKKIHISGGFTESPVWVQILSDITGKTLVLLQKDDASTLGAAMLAMKALGRIKDFREINPPGPKEEFKPNPDNIAVYQTLFEVYESLYPVLKNSMHRLGDIFTKVT